MNSTVANVTYCDLKDFSASFKEYHFSLIVVVCTLGTILNVLNICVLSRKQMRCPTNVILTSLAVADLLVMLEYIPFAYLHHTTPGYYTYYYTYTFASYIIFHAIFTQAFHFISCCITIILAVWRYVAVKFPQNNLKWCGNKRTIVAILLTYILCPFICIPLTLSIEVRDQDVFVDDAYKIVKKAQQINGTLLKSVTLFMVRYKENTILTDISNYVYGIVIKLLPCIFLTVLSALLIVELLKAKERRKKLMNPQTKDGGAKKKVNQRHLEKEKQADRTTRMLLAVLLLFLMVEFPQAVFGVLNNIVGIKFEMECYQPLGKCL